MNEANVTTSSRRASLYLPEAYAAATRLLSQLDREPHSVTYGSFDRAHWAWKFRDFPIMMLQLAAHPLALLWKHRLPDNSYHQSDRLLSWLEGSLDAVCERQKRNGAFDSVGPNTQDHGVSLAVAYGLTQCQGLLGDALSRRLRDRIRIAVRSACEFATRSSEDYGFISNHQALFALAWLGAGELLEESRYAREAERVIDTIIARQSPEGWYHEYEGTDPGYESLGIMYLASYWKRTGSVALLDSLRRSVEFYAHGIHPDASVGGVYGSRHTSLYFPSGFEILAPAVPLAGAIARFMGSGLVKQNAITPSLSDAENLAPLTESYVQAALSQASSRATDSDVQNLPCQSLDGTRYFPHAGILVHGGAGYYAIVSTAKGGVCRIFEKRPARIAYEDAGYLVRSGSRRWTSQLNGTSRLTSEAAASSGEWTCEGAFTEVRQETLTPVKFLVLRLLNLTVFRSVRLGAWVRRRIVARLITKKVAGPLRLRRAFRFESDRISIADRLEAVGTIRLDEVSLPRCFTAIHMGSAKYFHPPTDLCDVPVRDVAHLAEQLNRTGLAESHFTLELSATAGALPLPGRGEPDDQGANTDALVKT